MDQNIEKDKLDIFFEEHPELQVDLKGPKAPRFWAHRGCCMKYPENTIPAFQAAAAIPGVVGI